jgi:PPK2 family polyphosphate:nucleotide phosphotransferase
MDLKDFTVEGSKKINVRKAPTKVDDIYDSADDYERLLRSYNDKLVRLQTILYAHDRYAVLLIFQGMDTAGKDGAIRHVMSGVNPQGCQVFNHKQPSAEDLDHDFLWRSHKVCPERGRIGIFNRSYYEEVLIVRVHPEILNGEKIPEELLDGNKKFWQRRYEDIVNFERYLTHNGLCLIKFFLHLSKKEQRKRFLERIDDEDKNWKLSLADIEERQYWNDYMDAYEDCLNHTSTRANPWYVVPADDKKNARLIISQIVVERMNDLKMMAIPKLDSSQRKILQEIRKRLEQE